MWYILQLHRNSLFPGVCDLESSEILLLTMRLLFDSVERTASKMV